MNLRQFLTPNELADLSEFVKKEEGCVLTPYQDHLGYWTIGYGHLLGSKKPDHLATMTKEDAEYLLLSDLEKAYEIVDSIFEDDIKKDWSSKRKIALISMAFQLGSKLRKFTQTIAYIKEGNWQAAANSGLNSRWAMQTPKRAAKTMAMIKEG